MHSTSICIIIQVSVVRLLGDTTYLPFRRVSHHNLSAFVVVSLDADLLNISWASDAKFLINFIFLWRENAKRYVLL